MMRLTLIAALGENGVIGANGTMPWHLPPDLQRFRRLTLNKPILMGRRTFESLGRPLPQRRNIVLTRQAGWSASGVAVVADIAQALALCAGAPEVMVIGGGDVYAQFLPLATCLELTEIAATPPGDTFFPPVDWSQWREQARIPMVGDGTPDFAFVTYVRKAVS